MADFKIPRLFRKPFYTIWGKWSKINFEEFIGKLEDFESLQQFFQRKIIPRPINQNPQSVVSSTDGMITHVTELVKDENLDVKGIIYKVGELFTGIRHFELDEKAIERLKFNKDNKLYFVMEFLDYGNYHHYHAPVSFIAKTRNHIAGHIRTVEPLFWFEKKNIYEQNERVVLYGEWEQGFFAIVFIAAAWRVGAMSLKFDKDLNTRKMKIEPEHFLDIKEYPDGKPEFAKEDAIRDIFHRKGGDGIRIEKGDEIGMFHYGSSIAFLFEAGPNFEFVKKPGDPIFYGQTIGINHSA